MYRGSSFHTIDVKGRIIIPKRFRDVISHRDGHRLMVSRMDRSLVVYALREWEKIESKILSLAEKNDNMRRFRRVFIGGAFECVWDKQDRILVPPTLRGYAGLDKEIVLVGVLDHFEIWSRENWDKENATMEKDMKKEEVRNEIAKLGI
ncbi:MAG: division/cell wall cluster transcriptional repressor MraZ [Desulfobacterales bacterium]|nr:division/cell wall cluster transcriptional repressor MraZ [Desulfobacterales bacterium]MDX2511765.1 division/cell wall cluster transcriptional repressor MraZ [Desulfobacterales bacterium]RLC05155.1 MAG: division/cell wall cluster transcriptional repressor MraZ [Deltaproteobacteria bacterium]RLC11797.1 MAG: division/cell wall cluster transcriptional repressor MraZ [Deltaproteobacteria bacterium]HHE74463.1 division/cell wall cluster transcriptional repressor MraZ [Desulfobacteraceae bacterium]